MPFSRNSSSCLLVAQDVAACMKSRALDPIVNRDWTKAELMATKHKGRLLAAKQLTLDENKCQRMHPLCIWSALA